VEEQPATESVPVGSPRVTEDDLEAVALRSSIVHCCAAVVFAAVVSEVITDPQGPENTLLLRVNLRQCDSWGPQDCAFQKPSNSHWHHHQANDVTQNVVQQVSGAIEWNRTEGGWR
jgi:hypothetical protein